MGTEDQILLRLIIQGQSPEEINRLAQSTQGELNAKMKVYLDQLTALHRQAAEAQTAEEANRVKAAIDGTEKQVDSLAKIQRAQEIATNRMSNGWRRTLEDMENITVAAFGIGTAFETIKGKAFALAEDIDRLTNVYSSLKGSIAEMREASAGEISDFDLIGTKNRAMQLDLQLTDKQFGIVARAADNFADSIAGNTKEALDQLIQGLGTGQEKALKHAGAIKDVNDVYDRFAKSIGTTADKLSDQGKRVAIVEESLRNLDKKNKESGGIVDDFSHRWEKFAAETKNLADAFKIHLGEAILFVIDNIKQIPDVLELAKAKFMDLMNLGQTDNYGRVAAQIVAKQEAAAAAAQSAYQAAANSSTPGDLVYTGDRSHLINTDKVNAAAVAAAKERDKLANEYDDFIRKLGGFDKNNALGGGYDPTANQHPLLDQLGFQENRGLEAAAAESETRTIDALLNKAIGNKPEGGDSLEEQVAKFEKDFIEPLKQKTAAYESELEATKERAGGGLFSVLLFGRDGPDKTYKEMDSLQQATVDMSGVIAETMHKMAEQVGAEMANWIANTQGAKKSFRDMTNELLVALSTKAFVKGLEELAEAAGSYASYDYAGAAGHMEAAAAWGALGIAAGLGDRAVGHSTAATGASGGGTGGGLVARTGGGVGSSTGSSTASGPSGPLTINLTVLPGGEAEAGRAINKALDAYYAQTGKGRRAA